MIKNIVLVIVLLFILVSIPIAVFLVQKQQEIRMKAAPATVISFTPATVTKNVGETFMLEGTFDSGENLVSGGEIHITFDKTKLEAVSIEKGSLFPTVLSPGVVSNTNGTATIAVLCEFTSPIQGTGTLFTITFNTIATGTSQITYDASTLVTGTNEQTNVLAGRLPASITITDGTLPETLPLPSPSPTLGVSPTSTNSAGIGGTTLVTANTITPSPTTYYSYVTPTPTYYSYVTPTPIPTIAETLPVSGIFENTLIFSLGGFFLLGVGFLILLL